MVDEEFMKKLEQKVEEEQQDKEVNNTIKNIKKNFPVKKVEWNKIGDQIEMTVFLEAGDKVEYSGKTKNLYNSLVRKIFNLYSKYGEIARKYSHTKPGYRAYKTDGGKGSYKRFKLICNIAEKF